MSLLSLASRRMGQSVTPLLRVKPSHSLFNLSKPSLVSSQTLTGFEPSVPYKFTGPYLSRPVEDALTLDEYRKYNHDPLGHLNAKDRQEQNDSILHRHFPPLPFRYQLGYIYNKHDLRYGYGRSGRQDYVHIPATYCRYFFYENLIYAPMSLISMALHWHSWFFQSFYQVVLVIIGSKICWKYYIWVVRNGDKRRDDFIAASQTDHKFYIGFWDNVNGPDPVNGVHSRFGW